MVKNSIILRNNDKKPRYKLRKLSIGMCSFIFGVFILFNQGVSAYGIIPDSDNSISMVADRSGEGMSLGGGTSLRNVPQDYMNVITVPSSYYTDPPIVRVNINGKIKEYQMQMDKNNYTVKIQAEVDLLGEYKKSHPNCIEIIGNMSKSPRALTAEYTPDTNILNMKIRGKAISKSLIVKNKDFNLIDNYDYIPIVISNLRYNYKQTIGAYVEYVKMDGYDGDKNVMPEGTFKNKIIFPVSFDGNSGSMFYLKAPYGYTTNLYSIQQPKISEQDITLEVESNGYAKIPDRFGTYTINVGPRGEVPVMVYNSRTGTMSIPEFLSANGNDNTTLPSADEVTYSINDSDEEKRKIILRGVKIPDGAQQPEEKIILGDIPKNVSSSPTNVTVQLVYSDGSRYSVNVPVIVNNNASILQPGPGPVKPQETNSSDKDERSKRHEKTEKHEVVKKEKVKDNGVRYLDERVKITPVGIDDNNKFVYKRTLYIKGYPDNTVRPDNDLTRAEVAMILARLDGLELDDNEYPNFNDTKTDAWYNAAINAVVKKGYMKGYPDSKFYPNKKITRAELANIMVNVYSASGNELKNFSDIKSHWAEDAIKKASESGFVSGYEDGTFKPDKFITRAESVKMFNLLYLYKLSAGNILKIEESKDFKDFKDNEKKDWYYDDIVESTNDYYFTLDNKGVDISDTENEANINHISVSTDDINVIKDGYGSIVRFLNNGSTK